MHSIHVSSNRIKIQVILLILQLETDYFSSYSFQKMLHSKQWHYSLHRDFQNCYSTQRSPTGFFSSNSSSNSTRVPIHHTTSTYKLHTHAHIHPENSPSRIQFYMQKTKELFEYYYYYIQRAKRPSFQKRNSTHRRQGDLLEIHPCVLQDIPVFPDIPDIPVFPVFPDIPVVQDTPETFRTFQSFMTFQPLQAILQSSSISRESTPFQHSPIRMHILQFDWFPQKTPSSTS